MINTTDLAQQKKEKRNMVQPQKTNVQHQPDTEKTNIQEWVLKLAESNFHSTTDHGASELSKEERKAKREAVRARRQELKGHNNESRRLGGSSDSKEKKSGPSKNFAKATVANRKRLRGLMARFSSDEETHEFKRKRLFVGDCMSHHRKRRWDDAGVQPRACDYGGIGLARSSLFLSFDDPSWVPKLEEEFLEHIPGFFGKQRTKAMKKQRNANMLWKRLLEEKQHRSEAIKDKNDRNGTGKGKRSDMRKSATLNERVEDMLRSGRSDILSNNIQKY